MTQVLSDALEALYHLWAIEDDSTFDLLIHSMLTVLEKSESPEDIISIKDTYRYEEVKVERVH